MIFFALKFPRDFDLIMSMGVILHLFALRTVAQTLGTKHWLPWLVLVSGSTWAWTITGSLRTDGSTRHAPLVVNGRPGEVAIRPTERALVEVNGTGSFRLTVRTIGATTTTELAREAAPWVSKPFELERYGRVVELRVVYDSGEEHTVRVDTSRARRQ